MAEWQKAIQSSAPALRADPVPRSATPPRAPTIRRTASRLRELLSSATMTIVGKALLIRPAVAVDERERVAA